MDGRTASGKTTFAGKLARAVEALGRPVIHAQLDGFHNPKAVRYARGRMSAEGYYRDARDLEAVKRCLLAPFGPGGDRRHCLETLDLATDEMVEPDWRVAPEGAALIVDGSFLQRRELADCWDAVVFLDVDAATSRGRGVRRDGKALREAYDRRYLPAWDIYLSEVDPLGGATWVVPT